MAPMSLVYQYGDKKVIGAGSGTDAVRALKSLDKVEVDLEEQLGIPAGTYDVYDSYGKIERPEDLQRAICTAAGSGGECVLEIREHHQFVKLRDVEAQLGTQAAKILKLEADLKNSEDRMEQKIEMVKKDLRGMITTLDSKVDREVKPCLEGLVQDRAEMNKEWAQVQEKLGKINLQELSDVSENAEVLQSRVEDATNLIERLSNDFANDKAMLWETMNKTREEVKELNTYFEGKLDVAVETNGETRKAIEITNAKIHHTNDDLRIATEELRILAARCTGALEESDELRTLLGTVREDNKKLKQECGMVRTRVHCIEGAATEKWQEFAPGVIFMRHWHEQAKGPDVQLNNDLTIATGRGFLAATGVVLGSDEGLVVADGPCRRFGTPGQFSSYFEIEVEEVIKVPHGTGGLYIGVSVQKPEEIADHPKHEFDGWLMGGNSKALICRASVKEGAGLGPDDYLPGSSVGVAKTLGPEASEAGRKAAGEALMMLRKALPPKAKGEVREVESTLNTEGLKMGDRLGVLFTLHRSGGARMRVALNGDLKASQEFIDAPPAEALSFLTPIVRLAGSGKSVKLRPGIPPPARLLTD
eukprot:gnl/TRDRNA2_/TRDRNA2_133206_c0_seq1.p1 gnl/TRDRNA2_/TRDRNA2_133206_c0~~gnl/TRDRNA2_/TRDRNA2_133206_c0_seq1.p1  ORF type:complete len:589 (+),score=140.15 gnl/TRDRNA2_/TRDRNA2_133206_c0_seq1:87-1853(+)